MAKIIKKITGLKPQQNYIFTLKVKNSEVSAIDPPYDSIRVLTPRKSRNRKPACSNRCWNI